MNLKTTLKHKIINFPGWHTKRKIVVIHSDDWGSIRMPSNKTRKQLNKHSLIDCKDAYSKHDTLASKEDLQELFDVLTSFKDFKGNHPVITANCVMANPDFEAIKNTEFDQYCYINLYATCKKYNNLQVLKLWHEGIKEGIFIPQFHGREHVNVPFWLKKLKNAHTGVRTAFDYEVFSADFNNLGLRKHNFQAAWDFETNKQEKFIIDSLKDGMHLFKNMFGYTSATVIAPSHTWSPMQEKALADIGVKQMQGILVQKVPSGNKKKYIKKYRVTRSKGKILGYQMRNAFFEPTSVQHQYQTDKILKRIEIAFQMKKPAIIGSHRLNYIGTHDESNRRETLKQLSIILKTIMKKWPDVEFMSAEQLSDLMQSNQ